MRRLLVPLMSLLLILTSATAVQAGGKDQDLRTYAKDTWSPWLCQRS